MHRESVREASRSVQCKKVRSFAKSSLGSIGPCTEEGAPDMKKGPRLRNSVLKPSFTWAYKTAKRVGPI